MEQDHTNVHIRSTSETHPECNIYVLLCESNKYYVGKTTKDVTVRFSEHQSGKGSEWTRKYPPVKIVEIKKGDKWEEEVTFYRTAEKYGIDNVRGSSYSNVFLTKQQKMELMTKLTSVNDLCFTCKKPGHFASKCPSNKNTRKIATGNDNLNSKTKEGDSSLKPKYKMSWKRPDSGAVVRSKTTRKTPDSGEVVRSKRKITWKAQNSAPVRSEPLWKPTEDNARIKKERRAETDTNLTPAGCPSSDAGVEVQRVNISSVDTALIPRAPGIYVVHLEQNKWSVNYSSNMKNAAVKMLRAGLTDWTKIYRPLKIAEIFPDKGKEDVNSVTIFYMLQYGRENVRGGIWSRPTLLEYPVD